jgi:hypothetical protein
MTDKARETAELAQATGRVPAQMRTLESFAELRQMFEIGTPAEPSTERKPTRYRDLEQRFISPRT